MFEEAPPPSGSLHALTTTRYEYSQDTAASETRFGTTASYVAVQVGHLDPRNDMGLMDDLDALRKELSPEAAVLLPGDDGYEYGIRRWSDTCEKRANAVVQPASTADVSATVKHLCAANVPFTTVCGGHSTSGSSAISDGVVIDLRRHLNSVSVDAESRTITVQGGGDWAAVNEATMKHGLATVGGAVDHTGVGGLTLGGGYGYLSGRHGLSIDNLLAATMVLAENGRVVKTSATVEPDLFWAVRGAGQCFGVCTEFVFRLHPQREKVYAGLLVMGMDKLEKVVEFVNELGAGADPDVAMSWGFSAPPPAKQPVLLMLVMYNGDEESGLKTFGALKQLEPMVDTTGMVPYPQVNKLFNDNSGFGGRKLFGGSNFQLPLEYGKVKALADEFFSFTLDPDIGAHESTLVFEYVPFAAQNTVPVEATAFANRGEYYNVGLLWHWEHEKDDGRLREFGRTVSERTRASMGTVEQQDVGQYANYLGVTEKTERVFGRNTQRLRVLKGRYDPHCRFNKWHDLRPLPN